jgi:hypothetical protein
MFPFLIALMKLLGAFLTELLNILAIISATSVDDVVKDFIAFAIIAEIDDILGKTLKSIDRKDSVQIEEVTFDKKDLDKGLFQHISEFMDRMNCGEPLQNLEVVL